MDYRQLSDSHIIGKAGQKYSGQASEHTIGRRRTEFFTHEQAASREIQGSDEFQGMAGEFQAQLYRKEATLPVKTDLSKRLAMEHVEKRVNGFKAAEPQPKFHRPHKSLIPLSTIRQPSPIPREPKSLSPPRIRSVGRKSLTFGNRPHLEVHTGASGYVHFPSYPEEGSEAWDKLSETEASNEEVNDGVVTPKKNLLKRWFSKP